jgi:hypothetical protein
MTSGGGAACASCIAGINTNPATNTNPRAMKIAAIIDSMLLNDIEEDLYKKMVFQYQLP